MKLTFVEHHLYQFFRRFENQHLPIDLFLSQYFQAHKQLGSKDRRSLATTVYGICKWQLLVDHFINGHPSWEQRYAVFRNLKPDQHLHNSKIPKHIRVSCPKPLFSAFAENYGEEKALHLCHVNNTEAPIVVRINPLKTTREKLLLKWCELGATPCNHSPFGILFKSRVPLTSFPEFKEGLFEIQDEASQCVAELVKVKPGEHILDYCAGAGGKTLAFAPQMENRGQIYLHDIRPFILEQAKKRLRRAGIQNAQFLAPKHPQLSTLVKKMDWVLVDAPCSGTGTLRRNPDQKWKFSPELLSQLIDHQRMIFEQAVEFVKPGGHIVYATCSMLRAENEAQVSYFMKTHHLKEVGKPFVSLPDYGEMDGFFAAILKKAAV